MFSRVTQHTHEGAQREQRAPQSKKGKDRRVWIQPGLKLVFSRGQNDEKWSPRTCGMGRSVPSFVVTMKCDVKSKVFRKTVVATVSQEI